MAFSFENPVGRLILVRLEETISEDEVGRFRTKMWLTLSAVPHRAVLVGDMTRTVGFAAGVEEKLLAMLKVDNAKVERTAFILDSHGATYNSHGANFGRQVERIITDAAHEASLSQRAIPDRRAFRDRSLAQAWLNEVLTPPEREALKAFMSDVR